MGRKDKPKKQRARKGEGEHWQDKGAGITTASPSVENHTKSQIRIPIGRKLSLRL